MSKYIPGNQKHLTLEDRKYKECLSQSRAGINMTRHELHQEDCSHDKQEVFISSDVLKRVDVLGSGIEAIEGNCHHKGCKQRRLSLIHI